MPPPRGLVKGLAHIISQTFCLNLKRTPVKAGFKSSLLTAKDVFWTRSRKDSALTFICLLSFSSGIAGNSSASLPVISYVPLSVVIFALFLSPTSIVILVSSGSSFVTSSRVCRGRAASPVCSVLAASLTTIVISRSVTLRVVYPSTEENKTKFNMGRVERVGVAFETFCRAVCSSGLVVEIFIYSKKV